MGGSNTAANRARRRGVRAGASPLRLHALDDDVTESLAAAPVGRMLRAVRLPCPQDGLDLDAEMERRPVEGLTGREEVGGTGPLIMPFLKAIGQAVLWSALPNGTSATFYDLWSGHTYRPARFRRRLEEDLGHVFALLADGTITVIIAARFPLADVAAALTLAGLLP